MSRNNVHKRLAPALPWADCVGPRLAPQWLPYILGMLRIRALPYWWHPASRTLGRHAMNEAGVRMLLDCNDELLRVAQAQYRLLDFHLSGSVYTSTGTGTEADPVIVSPAIPDVPSPALASGSLRFEAIDLGEMLDNAINGTAYPNHALAPSIKDLLAEISAKIEAGEIDDEEMIRLLNVISLALG